MSEAIESLRCALVRALEEGRDALHEHEVYGALNAAGLRVPEHVFVQAASHVALPEGLRDGPVVLKIVSADILHKSDVGGVRFVDGARVDDALIAGFCADVTARHQARTGVDPRIAGTIVARRVVFDRARLGAEVLVGMRWSRDFGFVGLVGVGGVNAEIWGSRLPRREAAALFQLGEAGDARRLKSRMPGAKPACAGSIEATLGNVDLALRAIDATLVQQDLAGRLRGSQASLALEAWRPWVRFLDDVARAFPCVGDEGVPCVFELECNPVLFSRDGVLVPADALLRVGRAKAAVPPRPVDKLERLFRPRSIAVAGVSAKSLNMGRVILRNLIAQGWDASRLVVMNPGATEIDGVRCVAGPEDLATRVDLCVLAVAANQAPEVTERLCSTQKTETIIAIAGGMGETAHGKVRQARLERAVIDTRATTWRGPLLCGPNSMGIASAPGGFDTTFIPEAKLPKARGTVRNVAWVSQSGAFAIARMSKTAQIGARYLITGGNQMDLAIGDYVAHLARDPEVDVLAVYVEGFQGGDGARFLDASREAVANGKRVVLYKGGRSPEGQDAASGHTASIAGDYRVACQLATAAGVCVAESFEDYTDLVTLASLLARTPVRGRRVMLMSNAGFEAVGMADALRGEGWALDAARPSAGTLDRIRAALERFKIDSLVDARNPLDLTPVAPDEVHVACARAALEDDGVDALVMGIVPLSPAMSTLAEGGEPHERMDHPGSIATTLPDVVRASGKPVVVAIDSGRLYDPLADALMAGGVPVLRSADRAVRMLGMWMGGEAARGGSYCECRPIREAGRPGRAIPAPGET